jgi:GAF domain-containing protein
MIQILLAHPIANMYIDREQLILVLSHTIVTAADRLAALQTVADLVRNSGNFRWVGLYDVYYAKEIVTNIVFSGSRAPEFPTFPITKGLTGRAISTRQTVNVGDVAVDPNYLTAFGTTKSEIIVPIFDRLNRRVIGTIDIESELPFAFNEQMQCSLENLAKEIGKFWLQTEQM